MSSQLLMIEDDARLAEMVGEYLGQSGLQVKHCADGKSGLAQLQGSDAGPLLDLIFMELMLLLPKFVAGFSGDYVHAFGYAQFFTSTALLGLPVLLLVWLASRVKTASGA